MPAPAGISTKDRISGHKTGEKNLSLDHTQTELRHIQTMADSQSKKLP
jgi:hypothetical protein